MVPLATQRAPSRRATARAHSLPQGLPPASAAATATATTLESTSVTSSDARSVASSLLVAAATTAVSPGPSTLACSPSNRRFTTTIAGRGPAPCAPRRGGRVSTNSSSKTSATAVAPNDTTFLVRRALFGIGMGAEWGVGASLVMEKVPPRYRGVVSGFLQQGYALGFLLAALCYRALFPHFGWRPLFFIGGLPALLALFVRARVRESEVWRETRHESWGGLGRAIRGNLPLFAYFTVLMWMMNMVSHGTQDMYPTFLQRHWGFTAQQRGDITIISMVGALLGGVTFGLYSDRLGRRRAIGLALCAAVVVIPLWAFAPSVPLLVVGAFVMQFFVQGAWGVIPAHINELSPDPVRGFLPGFAYQCGVALAGAIGWLEARFAEHLDYAWAMALTAATVFILGTIVAQLGPERRGVAFGRGSP